MSLGINKYNADYFKFHFWMGDTAIHAENGDFIRFEKTPQSKAMAEHYRAKGTTALLEYYKQKESDNG
jgi:hypothetical protein